LVGRREGVKIKLLGRMERGSKDRTERGSKDRTLVGRRERESKDRIWEDGDGILRKPVYFDWF